MNSQKKIMIVEDAMMVALHIQKSLEAVGYTVLPSLDNGEEALQKAIEWEPNLILMDIMLAGEMDGIETSSSIRAVLNVPVIYLTALTDQETIARAKVTEPFGYIMKPFNERELHTNIEMALYKHEVETQLRESEERFYSTVKSTSDFLVTLNSDLSITYVNPRVEDIAGKPLDTLVNKGFEAVLQFKPGVEETEQVEDELIAYLLENMTFEGPLRLAHNGQHKMFGDFQLSKIKNSVGEETGYLVTFKDITDKYLRQELERKLELKNLTALIEGQEKERLRVARDLHDSIGQMLSGIKLHLDTVMPSIQNPEGLISVVKLLNETILETNRISENLMPSNLENLTLRECLNALCRNMNFPFKGEIDFKSEGPIVEIAKNQKINVYRIVQEAINNAIKYADADTITVQFTIIPSGSLDLTIEDDGKGFDIRSVLEDIDRPHHGLQNMRDRAHIMEGELSIVSNPEMGTLVHLHIPLPKHK